MLNAWSRFKWCSNGANTALRINYQFDRVRYTFTGNVYIRNKIFPKQLFWSTLKLSSHHGDDIHCLERWNLISSNTSPKIPRQGVPTSCARSVLSSSSSIEWLSFKVNIGDISKVIVVIVKHDRKKEKIKKTSLLYLIRYTLYVRK